MLRFKMKPVIIRSRLILETASEMASSAQWPYRQARVSLREQGDRAWPVTLFASDNPAAIWDVARGEAQIAIINPSAPLTLAARGSGPFKEPIPVRAISVIPSYDQLAFAVSKQTGLTSLEEVGQRRYPLRISMRGEPDHSTHFFLREVLAAVGWSLDDLRSWGGRIQLDPFPPNVEAVARGEIDAIFDEAIDVWTDAALEQGMRFLSLSETMLRHMEGLGFRRGIISKADYPGLNQDVSTLDFSGWPIYTLASVPDEVITAFCTALEARRDHLPWHGEGPLPLEVMCKDTPETALGIPLHPAAERFWRERGYLP